MNSLGHMVTRHVLAPRERAFTYLIDPIKLGRWSLGCFQTFLDDQSGVYSGKSLFDGSQGWFKIDPEPSRMLIDYWVGLPEKLAHRISVRVIDGFSVAYDGDTCLVMMMAWRPASMGQERWERLCASHEAEIWLIKEQIETEYRTIGMNAD
jgi:hypothetical protein